LKVNDTLAQTDINDAKSIELERIYIKKEYKGKGLGKKLINFTLQSYISHQKN